MRTKPVDTARLSSSSALFCTLLSSVHCGKTADSIEMPFGVMGLVVPRNYELDGGPDTPPPKKKVVILG